MQTEIPIPHPDNPQHVENLASLALLEAQGFGGLDVSLDISLGEYGIAWRTIGDEVLFVYAHPSIPGKFDRSVLRLNIDPFREWDWAMRPEFFAYLGIPRDEWAKEPFPHQVCDLARYYGPEEIFGTSYWIGFDIEGVEPA